MSPDKEYLKYQKKTTEYFRLWRAGRRDEWNADPKLHEKQSKDIQFPLPGQWKGHTSRYLSTRTRYRITKASGTLGPQQYRAKVKEVAQNLQGKLSLVQLRLEKLLGWGGQGIACLFNGTDSTGEIFKFVCKTSLQKEYEYILERERRSHFVSPSSRVGNNKHFSH